ncbi:MAG: hypothetical protein ACM3ON_06675 [Chloroflexota bacterium]
MHGMFRWIFFIALAFSSSLLLYGAECAEPLKFSSSTQFLWGDDELGNSQNIFAQYLRLTYNPEGGKIGMSGYGRVIYDLNSTPFYEDTAGAVGRLYYLYLDYTPVQNVSMRLGRQFIAFTADQAIMDGLRVDVHNLGPIGITLAGGMDVQQTLQSSFSELGNYFWGIDVHLERVKSLQLGISFSQTFDQWDRARELFGGNFRYVHKFFSPYAQAQFSYLTNSFDEVTAGVDIFPLSNLLVKFEYYQAYPTFDSTSIYSVFAVEQYKEYLVEAEYSFEAPVVAYASYVKQQYQDGDNADRWTLGTKVFPLKNLNVNLAVDYRHGYGGNLWGFEITSGYKIIEKLILDAGVQYDVYERPDQFGNQFARRYWIGGDWLISKNMSAIGRIEDNVNETFEHRTLGRVAFNWAF